ncbi:MAG: hypothetical protein H6626_08020 [Pseudobdellovibrionaceae bacterium]|nr:hypothetical protein [Bdellovibrionales bacterium]USN46170.1 MAG: hypothetical protein H6626_08020 [Pseudobdellovibrionaceae bacterium]
MFDSRPQDSVKGDRRQSQSRGQIVVEYVLLLMVGVSLALIITRLVVSRNPDPDDQGFLIKTWSAIIQTIGDDTADAP